MVLRVQFGFILETNVGGFLTIVSVVSCFYVYMIIFLLFFYHILVHIHLIYIIFFIAKLYSWFKYT